MDPNIKRDLLELTSSELATYQAMRARGFTHEDALSDALDGVSVETVRKMEKPDA